MAEFSKDSVSILIYLVFRKWPNSTSGVEWLDLLSCGTWWGYHPFDGAYHCPSWVTPTRRSLFVPVLV